MSKEHQSQKAFQKPRQTELDLPAEDPFGIHLKILWRTENWRKCWDVLRNEALTHLWDIERNEALTRPFRDSDSVFALVEERCRQRSLQPPFVSYLPVWGTPRTEGPDVQIRRYERGSESRVTIAGMADELIVFVTKERNLS